MISRKTVLVVWGLVATMVVMIGAGLGFRQDDVDAAPANQNSSERVINVMGIGTVQGEPDTVFVNLGVDVINADVKQAVSEATSRIETITTTLQEAGVAEDDIRTDVFNIFQESFYPDPNVQPDAEPSMQFRVLIMLSITVRDIDTIGNVVEDAITSGANSVNSIQFGIEDPSELITEARTLALQDAHQRADHIADEIGVTLGGPLRVEEFGSPGPLPIAQAFGKGGGGAGVPIETGSLSITVNVSVVYSME
jgi:uncharacterized protein YggE